MTGGKAAGGRMAHHALLDVQISSTLHLKLAALKVLDFADAACSTLPTAVVLRASE